MIDNVPTYADVIYGRIREEILTGVVKSGDRLAELDLARRMGTSQGPVREALARLRAEGLIITFHHRGSFVSEISIEEARDTYNVRQILEPYALSLALPQMGDQEFAILEAEIERMTKAAKAGRFTDNVAHDMAFHRHIFDWSNSPILRQIWHTIEAKTRKFVAVASPTVFEDPQKPAMTHYALLNLMRQHDLPALQTELQNHLAAIWIEIEDTTGESDAA
jgi:DNA-binding GntR family transcriptional regulator